MVLERLSNDGFATIFLEPVNTADFPDYEEIIDQPMDLGTVKKKLESKKYQAPEQFARDVRKVRVLALFFIPLSFVNLIFRCVGLEQL
jgi:Bromodomain